MALLRRARQKNSRCHIVSITMNDRDSSAAAVRLTLVYIHSIELTTTTVGSMAAPETPLNMPLLDPANGA